MRKLVTTLAGVALVAGLAAPARADDTPRPPDRSTTTYHHSTRDDRPGEGRAHYDKRQHDDPAILF